MCHLTVFRSHASRKMCVPETLFSVLQEKSESVSFVIRQSRDVEI